MRKPLFWVLVIIIVAIVLFVYSKHKNMSGDHQRQNQSQPVTPPATTRPDQSSQIQNNLPRTESPSVNENTASVTTPIQDSSAPTSEDHGQALEQSIPLQTT